MRLPSEPLDWLFGRKRHPPFRPPAGPERHRPRPRIPLPHRRHVRQLDSGRVPDLLAEVDPASAPEELRAWPRADEPLRHDHHPAGHLLRSRPDRHFTDPGRDPSEANGIREREGQHQSRTYQPQTQCSFMTG